MEVVGIVLPSVQDIDQCVLVLAGKVISRGRVRVTVCLRS